eukprot:CAMPEP_0117653812 /NCGR_PEP_ID=MMETSP0804-20121206/3400_1 /TAXON_ID=1074897 /ORGANISM="Tetraselmis astigmatica, Strain CCMP880" /LENGTH=582 /DNA_ID=CAMNT_0005460031 /DNA_START=580 /DNA_END=2325 /DNA_ORIENTATION=+
MSLVADGYYALAAAAVSNPAFGYPAFTATVGHVEMKIAGEQPSPSTIAAAASQDQVSNKQDSPPRTLQVERSSRNGLNPMACAFQIPCCGAAPAQPATTACESAPGAAVCCSPPRTGSPSAPREVDTAPHRPSQLFVACGFAPTSVISPLPTPLLSPPRIQPSNSTPGSADSSFSSCTGECYKGFPELASVDGARALSMTPRTPPQQRVLPLCSSPALRPSVSSPPADSADVAPSPSASARAPFTLGMALSDAIARNSLPEVLAGLDNGLSPDSSVQWCPPGNGSAAPVERSLLALAAFYGAKDVLVQLLARGANPNLASCDDGMTPLHAAAAGENTVELKSDIIHRLLVHGGNRDALDMLGRRPVELLNQQQGRDSGNPIKMQQQQMQQIVQNPHLDESFEDYGVIVGPHVPSTGGSELPDINRPEYSTDEFRINCFKVLKCSKTYAHDWTECPFVHPGEKARRRSPQQYTYSCSACPDFRKGVCRRGDLCGFSHGVFECWLHPARYRTQMCKDGVHCTRRVCFFAHSVSELRIGSLSQDNSFERNGELSPTSPSSSPLFSPTAIMGQIPTTEEILADLPR